MTLWCIKGGSHGERENIMLDKSLVSIGWKFGDLSKINSKKELDELYKKTYPDASPNRRWNHIGQLWSFINKIQKGDLVAVPLKTRATVAIGEITSEYKYREDLGEDNLHTRDVEWIKEDIPRTIFDQDILYSFGAFMTISKVRSPKAEERVKAILEGKKINVAKEIEQESEEVGEEMKDVETLAENSIIERLNRKFRGHEFTSLINEILKAKGFLTRMSPAGADGGVDILAGHGPMGFDKPKIVVQVKSSNDQVEASIVRDLIGTMSRFKATQGLLVSWGGYKRGIEKEFAPDYFGIRFWDSGDVINELKKEYDKLPESIQAEIPLKKIWVLSTEDEE